MLRLMKLAALALTALLVGSPRAAAPPALTSGADEGPEFGPAIRTLPYASACAAELVALVRASTPPAYDAAIGPYAITVGDIRAHRIKARDWGHEIEEFRCLGATLSTRSWTHSLSDVKPFTIEDIGRMSFPPE